MRLGLLDRRAKLQRRTKKRNELGEEVIGYSTYATVWAAKLDLRGREYFAAQQVQAEAAVKITLRWRTDMQATDRVVIDGLNYSVLSIAEIPRHRGLELLASVILTANAPVN